MSAIEELEQERLVIRAAYAALLVNQFKSTQAKAVIRKLDRLCVEITGEVEHIQPSLLAPPLPMRVSGGVR